MQKYLGQFGLTEMSVNLGIVRTKYVYLRVNFYRFSKIEELDDRCILLLAEVRLATAELVGARGASEAPRTNVLGVLGVRVLLTGVAAASRLRLVVDACCCCCNCCCCDCIISWDWIWSTLLTLLTLVCCCNCCCCCRFCKFFMMSFDLGWRIGGSLALGADDCWDGDETRRRSVATSGESSDVSLAAGR